MKESKENGKESRPKFKLSFMGRKSKTKTSSSKKSNDNNKHNKIDDSLESDGGLSDYSHASQSTLKRVDSNDSDTPTEGDSNFSYNIQIPTSNHPQYTVRQIANTKSEMVKKRSKSVTPPSNSDNAKETPPRRRWIKTRTDRANSASRVNTKSQNYETRLTATEEVSRRHTLTVASSDVDVQSLKSNNSSISDNISVYDHLAHSFPAHAEAIYGAYFKKTEKQKQQLPHKLDEDAFKRNVKIRCSLPVVKPTNHTLEKPLGLVLLTFRSETKRATLPNEITSMDTVRALFVRSFPSILSMTCTNWSDKKIYILDHSTNVYYELENVLDIHNRSVLKVVEVDSSGNYPLSEPIYSLPNKQRTAPPTNNFCLYASPSELNYHSTPLPERIYANPHTLQDSGSTTPTPRDPETHARMTSMEAQLAHLTAWVQTAVKPDRPSSNCSSLISDSEIQPQLFYLNHLMSVQKEIQLLKSEQEQLKDKHLTNVRNMHELFTTSFNKIEKFLLQHQCKQSKVESVVGLFDIEKQSMDKKITDLEFCVDEIRSDVLKHKCRVNLTEVSKLAIGLSNISKRLAEMKTDMPEMENQLKSAMTEQLQTIVRAEKFLTEETDFIETDLKRCKKIMTVLSTLKRLASAQRTKGSESLKFYTRIPTEQDKKSLLNDIKCLLPNHDARLACIERLETNIERRKRIIHYVDHFEKSLEIAQKHLKNTENTKGIEDRQKSALSELFSKRELPRPTEFDPTSSRGGRVYSITKNTTTTSTTTSTNVTTNNCINTSSTTSVSSSTSSRNQRVTFSPAVTEISKCGSAIETKLKKVPPPPPPRKSSKLIDNGDSIYSTIQKRDVPPPAPPPTIPQKLFKNDTDDYHLNYKPAKRTSSLNETDLLYKKQQSSTNILNGNNKKNGQSSPSINEISTLQVQIKAEKRNNLSNDSKAYSETEIF